MLAPGDPKPGHTIADVLFPGEDTRLVVRVHRDLARDEDVADLLTGLIVGSHERSELEGRIHEVAESLEWQVSVEPIGSTDVLRIEAA